jgi:hypothetical protein
MSILSRSDHLSEYQRFHVAIEGLATSTSEWQGRLIAAARRILVMQPAKFPENLRERYSALMSALTQVDTDNPVIATVALMKEEDGRRVMKEIFSIYDCLALRV